MIFKRRAPGIRGRRVIVHLNPAAGDLSVKGIPSGDFDDAIVLVDPQLLLPGGEEQELGGRARFPWQNVAWIEEL